MGDELGEGRVDIAGQAARALSAHVDRNAPAGPSVAGSAEQEALAEGVPLVDDEAVVAGHEPLALDARDHGLAIRPAR